MKSRLILFVGLMLISLTSMASISSTSVMEDVSDQITIVVDVGVILDDNYNVNANSTADLASTVLNADSTNFIDFSGSALCPLTQKLEPRRIPNGDLYIRTDHDPTEYLQLNNLEYLNDGFIKYKYQTYRN